MKRFDEPYHPAREAVIGIAKSTPDVAPAIARILSAVEMGTRDGDALRSQIAAVIDQVCPLTIERRDDPQHIQNAAVRSWVRTTFDLLTAHLDI